LKKIIISLSLLGALLGSNAASAWDIWTTIGVKEWFTTYSPGVLPPDSKVVSIISLTMGGERLFVNAAGSSPAEYVNPAYPSPIKRNQVSFNAGYMATSKIAATVGIKFIPTEYVLPILNKGSNDPQPISLGPFYILGLVYSHSFEDSPFSINGNIAYGKANRTFEGTKSNATGSLGGSATYLGYEVSGSYAITQSFSLNLGYRAEQYDDLIPVSLSGTVYTLSMEKIKVNGATAGFAYKF
jgi:hypothetical protein